MPLTARCSATLAGDELILTMRSGDEHCRIPVDDIVDPAETMERMHRATMPVLLLWTVDRTERPPLTAASAQR